MPNRIRISIYNSAGELVKTLFDGNGTELQSVGLSSDALVPGGSALQFNFSGNLSGAGSLSWQGDNDNGQPVGGGIYAFKVETKDPFGTTSAWVHLVSVVPAQKHLSLNIYNSAGELVARLDPAAAGAASATGLKFGGDGRGSFSGGSVAFMVTDGNGVDRPLAWDGKTQNGARVSSGSYSAQLVDEEPGSARLVSSKNFVILNAPVDGALAAIAFPSPLGPGDDAIQFIYAPRPAGQSVSLQLYNAAGELVAEAIDPSGSGTMRLPARDWAGGIYVAVLELREGRGILGRQLLKVAIRK